MRASTFLPLAVLASTAISAPTLVARDTFDDGFGQVPNDMFSLIMTPDLKFITITGAGHADRNFLPKNPAFTANMACKDKGQDWEYFQPSWMPYGVMIHGGNLCTDNIFTSDKDGFDNLWVKYANQYLNTPTDTRCGMTSAGGSMRCLVPLHP